MQRSLHVQEATRRLSPEKLLAQWRVISEKLPKGFEKYFQDKTPAAGSDASKTATPESSSSSSSQKTEPPAQNEKAGPPKGNDWSFGMFSPTNTKSGRSSSGGSGGGGGSGKPLGGEDNDKEKWLMFGAISALAIAGAIVYFEVGYKEIGWKEFVNK